MNKINILAAVAIAFCGLSVGSAQAEPTLVNGQQTVSTGTGTSEANIASGAVVVNSYGAPEAGYKEVRTTGTQTLKSTGQAIAPGVYNSSGLYTCFGGASGGLGVPGLALTAGGTTSQKDCYALHRMDKAAGRAGAAIKAAADATQPADVRATYAQQAERFSKLWDAEYCGMEGGSAAFAKAGLECPDEAAKKAASEQRANAVMVDSTDPYIAERRARTGR